MGSPASGQLNGNLTFSVTTHNAATGDALNADSAPTYRVYEDGGVTPVETGVMAALDAANVTGLYSKTLVLTGANGYSIAKTYTIRIEATVGGIIGSVSYEFQLDGGSSSGGGGASAITISCPDKMELGQNVVFSVRTHDPATGQLSAADAAPTYRIYERETAVPILTGATAPLDSANITGAYTEEAAVTSANGFDLDKDYTVVVDAAVGGKLIGATANFRVQAIETILRHKRVQDVSTGVQQYYDGAGLAPVVTVTPSQVGGNIELNAS